MLTEVCQYLRNWFARAQCYGKFTIANGTLNTQYDTGVAFSSIPLVNGQYFRIVGSALNDGVYQYPTYALHDETFDGAVWTMAVPPAVIAIVDEIKAWQDLYNKPDSQMMSPFTSESFGGYSYTKGSGRTDDGSGEGISWKNVFAARLSPWRKI